MPQPQPLAYLHYDADIVRMPRLERARRRVWQVTGLPRDLEYAFTRFIAYARFAVYGFAHSGGFAVDSGFHL